MSNPNSAAWRSVPLTCLCNQPFARSGKEDTDYENCMVADSRVGTSVEAHGYAMDRMVQAGVVPVTW